MAQPDSEAPDPKQPGDSEAGAAGGDSKEPGDSEGSAAGGDSNPGDSEGGTAGGDPKRLRAEGAAGGDPKRLRAEDAPPTREWIAELWQQVRFALLPLRWGLGFWGRV